MKTIIAIFVSVLSFLPAQAGLFFDDPVDIGATSMSDAKTGVIKSIKFAPRGKCEFFIISHPELTLEVKYPTTTKTFYASQQMWTKSDPIEIKIPDGTDIQSFRLKGKFLIIGQLVENKKGKGKYFDGKFDLKEVSGYKIDSSWTVK